MSLDSKYNRMTEFNKFYTSFTAVKTKKQKHDSKRSELWKMSTSFTKSIIVLMKVIMAL